MSDQSNREEIRQSLLHQLDQSKQIIGDFTNEELEAIAGGVPNLAQVVKGPEFAAYKNGIQEGVERSSTAAQTAKKGWDMKSLGVGAAAGAGGMYLMN